MPQSGASDRLSPPERTDGPVRAMGHVVPDRDERTEARDTPKKPTAVPSSLPTQFDTAVRPAGAVAVFQISHEMDLKRQIVIILPKGAADLSASSGKMATAGVGRTKGQVSITEV